MPRGRIAKRSRPTAAASAPERENEATNEILITSRVDDFSEAAWWMVDVDGPAVTQGATPLVKRCMREYGWDLAKTRKVLMAYRQFLFLKKHFEDWDAQLLSPSLLVDQMWHQHILDVVHYCHDMMLLCGRVVGHNPDGALDVAGKRARDMRTREALEVHFHGEYDREVWGVQENNRAVHECADLTEDQLTIRVWDLGGEVTFFKVKRNTQMAKIFNAYASRKGVHPASLRFLCRGDRIDYDATPSSLGLEDQDHIDCLLEQRGC
jgi:small ubiquitin-related modifier